MKLIVTRIRCTNEHNKFNFGINNSAYEKDNNPYITPEAPEPDNYVTCDGNTISFESNKITFESDN